MSKATTYLEAAKEGAENDEIMRNSINKVIKKADDDGLLEIAHYVLGDMGDYGEESDMDLDQVADDLFEAIKKAPSKEIARLYTIFRRMKLVGESESKLANKELFMEAMSAMRKLKKFKDVKEARAALDDDFKKLAAMFNAIEDTISDMVFEVSGLLTWDGAPPFDEDIDDDAVDEAMDKAHAMFNPLMKGVTSFDFKRVKEKIIATVNKNINDRHEKQAESNSTLSDMGDVATKKDK